MTNGSKAKRSTYNDSLSYADEIQQLFVHCRQGNTEAVERWLATHYLNGAAQKGGQSPLKLLLFSTPSRRKELLCELRDPASGYSLLHQAALHGHLPIVQLLKEKEPRLLEVKDRRGCFPIQLAAWGGHESVVEELLTPQTLNSVNNARESAMHLASMRGHATVVELLLRRGGDVTLRNARHETALDVAARSGNAGVCKVLMERRPELTLQSAADCYTSKCPALYPLHAAARHGYTDCVKVLGQAGFDVNYVTEEGSALHVAALAGHIETVHELLEQGADPSIRNTERKTVLEQLNEGHGANSVPDHARGMIQGAGEGVLKIRQPSPSLAHLLSQTKSAAHKPCPKTRKSVEGGRPIATAPCDQLRPPSATASYEMGSTWIPIPEGSIVRLNSIEHACSKPAPAPRTPNTLMNSSINSVTSSSGAGDVGGNCECNYKAPANYDAWAAPTARPVYANAEPRLSAPQQQSRGLLSLNYDNVPRSLLIYDNAPPPGHRRWPHHCLPPPKSSHSASSSTASDAVVVSQISGSQSSSAASSATTGCGNRELSLDDRLQQIVVEGLLAPLARPEELSCSNSTNFSASLSPAADSGDSRADARERTTSSEGIAEQKSSSTLVGGGKAEEPSSAEACGASRRTYVNGAMQCSLDSITSSCSLPAVSQLSTTPPSPSPIPIDDGRAQWEDIEQLLGTLYDASGGGGRETKGGPKSELFYWLRDSVGLVGEIAPEAESRRLVNNGFDRVDMLKGSLTTLHMIEMGMPRSVQLRIADWLEHEGREGIRQLSDFDSLSDWMHSLGLANHIARFKDVNLTDLSDIAAARLTRGDLEVGQDYTADTAVPAEPFKKMGIGRLGHVSRILRSVALSGEKQNGGGHAASQCFTAHYLGSRKIRDGPTAQMDADVMADHCRKILIHLKKDLDPASMVPQVRLEISHRGVMLQGSSTEASGSGSESVWHAAEQINGVCQDETDLNFFAYVHWDGVDESTCHVFCLLTANLARDAITAINAVKDHTGIR